MPATHPFNDEVTNIHPSSYAGRSTSILTNKTMKNRSLGPLLLISLWVSNVFAETEALTTSTNGLVFENKKFGISVVKPVTWYVQNIENMIAAHQMGVDLMAGDNQDMHAMLEASLNSTLPLFGFFETDPETPASSNASFIGVAENIVNAHGLNSACDYLSQARQLIKRSQIRAEMKEECLSYEVDGASLNYFTATMDMESYQVKQIYLACLSGDHALAFVSSIINRDNAPEIDTMLGSLKVKCD